MARLGVDGRHGRLEHVVKAGSPVCLGGLVPRCLLRRLLGGDVERRDDGEPALEYLRLRHSQLFLELLAHVAGEVRVGEDAVVRGDGLVDLEGSLLRRVVLLLGDIAIRQHPVEHEIASLYAVLAAVDKRVVVRRRLGNAHEGGSLGQRQVGRVLREVALRGGLDAVRGIAVVDGVEVHAQYLVFRVHFLELDGKVHLAHLALDGYLIHLVGEDGVAHELLRDGRGTLATRSGDVHHECTGDAGQVEAAVLVEALVLGCHRSIEHILADLVQLNRLAVVQLEFGKLDGLGAVPRLARERGIEIVRIRDIVLRQIADPGHAEGVDAHAAGDDYGRQDADDDEQPDLGMLLLGTGPVLH